MPMITEVIERVLTVLTPAPEPSHPTHDIEYLADWCEYKHLALFVERDGARLIRCEFCGEYFEPTEIGTALDHVASHSNHITDEIDALEKTEQEVRFDYSQMLEPSDTPEGEMPVASDPSDGEDHQSDGDTDE